MAHEMLIELMGRKEELERFLFEREVERDYDTDVDIMCEEAESELEEVEEQIEYIRYAIQ